MNKLDWRITNTLDSNSSPPETQCTLFLNQFEELIKTKAPLTIDYATLQIRNIHKPNNVIEYDVIRSVSFRLDLVIIIIDY